MRTQKIVFILFCLIIGGLPLLNCQYPEKTQLCLYTDPQHDFRLEYPDSGWSLTTATGIPEVLIIIKSADTVRNFIPNVTVAVEFIQVMMTAEAYGDKNKKAMVEQGYEIISQKRTVIHHLILYDLHYINRQCSPALQFRSLCLVKDRIGFVITCTAPEKNYSNFQNDFISIVNSFRFL